MFFTVRKKLFGALRLGVGLIVGVVIAVIVICVMCCVVIVCCFQKRRGRRGYVRTPQSSTPGVTVTTTAPPAGSYPGELNMYSFKVYTVHIYACALPHLSVLKYQYMDTLSVLKFIIILFFK